MLVRRIVEVCLRALRRGASLGDLCTRVDVFKIYVGAARQVLGQNVGWKIDRLDISFVLRAGVPGVLRETTCRVPGESAARPPENHSTNCLLHQIAATPETPAQSMPAMLYTHMTSDNVRTTCRCDFFTDTAVKEGLALSHAFFLTHRPISSLYAAEAGGSVPKKYVAVAELQAVILRFRNGKQDEDVRTAANRVSEHLQMLEALMTSHNECASEDCPGDLAARRFSILEQVADLLVALTGLARAAGLGHNEVTEVQFSSAVNSLRELEVMWHGAENLPALQSALLRHDVSGPEEQYKVTVHALVEKATTSSHPPPSRRQMTDHEFVHLWKARVDMHNAGKEAVVKAQNALRRGQSNLRRERAREKMVATLPGGDVQVATGGAGTGRRPRVVRRRPTTATRRTGRQQARDVQAQETGNSSIDADTAKSIRGSRTSHTQASAGRAGGGASAGGRQDGDGGDVGSGSRQDELKPPRKRRRRGTAPYSPDPCMRSAGPEPADHNTTAVVPGCEETNAGSGAWKQAPGDGRDADKTSKAQKLPRQQAQSAPSRTKRSTDGQDQGSGSKDALGAPPEGKQKQSAVPTTGGSQSQVFPSEERRIHDTQGEPPVEVGGAERNKQIESTVKGGASSDKVAAARSTDERAEVDIKSPDGAVDGHDAPDTSRKGTVVYGRPIERARDADAAKRDSDGDAHHARPGISDTVPDAVVGADKPLGNEGSSQLGRRRSSSRRHSAGRTETESGTGGDNDPPGSSEAGGVASAMKPTTMSEVGAPKEDGPAELVPEDAGNGSKSGSVETGAEHRLRVIGGQQRSRELYFDNANRYTVPPRVKKQAMSELPRLETLLPRSLASGCDTKWFVTCNDVESMRMDFGARGFIASGSGRIMSKHGRDFIRDLDRDGYAIIKGVFNCGAAKDDIDTVIRSATTRLGIVHGDPDRQGELDPGSSFMPIPNLGERGGRSMAHSAFLAQMAMCRTKEHERIARASHRHQVRTCILVDSLVISDVPDGKPVASFTHECASTGGRVLITHPPTVTQSGDTAGTAQAQGHLPQGAPPQRPHIDFRIPTRPAEEHAPDMGCLPSPLSETSVFVICTGETATALRVYPSSHLWSHCHAEIHAVGVQRSTVRVLHVPPYSFLVMRGDCYHAGAGWLESKWANDALGVKVEGNDNFMRGIARWHTYFPAKGAKITNALHLAQLHTTFPRADVMGFPDSNGKRFLRFGKDFASVMEDVAGSSA